MIGQVILSIVVLTDYSWLILIATDKHQCLNDVTTTSFKSNLIKYENNRRNTDLVHQHVRISSLRQSLYPVYDAIRWTCFILMTFFSNDVLSGLGLIESVAYVTFVGNFFKFDIRYVALNIVFGDLVLNNFLLCTCMCLRTMSHQQLRSF